MELNYSKIFNKKIMQAVSAYCKLNDIEDVDGFIKKCFESGFNIQKYGLLGKTLNEGEKDLKIDGIREKWVEKEVIVEKRVEVPVEVIKEIEKIIEVPVEVVKEIVIEKEVIKEVPIEKIVTKIEYISDKTTEDELGGIIAKLKNEMSKKDEKLDEFRRTLDISRQTLADDGKLNKLQQTIQTLNSEIRDLKKKNGELEKQLLDKPKQLGNISAKFYGSSNLNDDIYK